MFMPPICPGRLKGVHDMSLTSTWLLEGWTGAAATHSPAGRAISLQHPALLGRTHKKCPVTLESSELPSLQPHTAADPGSTRHVPHCQGSCFYRSAVPVICPECIWWVFNGIWAANALRLPGKSQSNVLTFTKLISCHDCFSAQGVGDFFFFFFPSGKTWYMLN